jgi:hypothetical protein
MRYVVRSVNALAQRVQWTAVADGWTTRDGRTGTVG